MHLALSVKWHHYKLDKIDKQNNYYKIALDRFNSTNVFSNENFSTKFVCIVWNEWMKLHMSAWEENNIHARTYS